MSFEFLSPLAGLVALLGLVPARCVRPRRGRAPGAGGARSASPSLGAARASFRSAALVAAAACLGLAAMQPVVSLDETRRVRTDAEALVVLDTTRSMLASATPGSRSRIERAKAVAAALHGGAAHRARRPRVAHRPRAPASLPERRTARCSGRRSTRRSGSSAPAGALVLEPGDEPRGALGGRDAGVLLADREQADPRRRHRRREPPRDARAPRPRLPAPARDRRPCSCRSGIATSGCSAGRCPSRAIGRTRARAPRSTVSPPRSEARCSPRSELARRGDARVPQLVGSGPSVVQGERRRDVALAPYLAAAAFLPLVLVLWRRDR